MAGHERKGGLQKVDPAVRKFQQQAAQNTAALTGKQRADLERKDRQVKLDLATPERKRCLEYIAKREKTSVSQAGNLLLSWAMCHYLEGEAEIRDAFYDGHQLSRTPRFDWNIDEPDTWANVLDHFQSYGDIDGDI